MQKNLFLSSLIALSLTSVVTGLLSPVLAASPSPSATSSAEPASISEVTENLKKRLQDSLEDEPNKPALPSARGYIGVVKDVIKDTIIVEDKDGKRDIVLESDTVILRSPGNAVIKADNIRIDDYIIAIGYPSDDEMIKGRRLIVSTEPIEQPAKTSGHAVITKIAKSTLTVTVGGEEKILYLTSKTIYKSASGTIELSDLAEGDTLIYTATIDEDDDLTATHMMRIASTPLE